jgi:hypothetical protein
MITTLILIVAQAVAIQCVGYDCIKINYFTAMEVIKLGGLEMIFEVYGFIRIYKKKDKEEDK